jgi:phosphonate transport system permease protein
LNNWKFKSALFDSTIIGFLILGIMFLALAPSPEQLLDTGRNAIGLLISFSIAAFGVLTLQHKKIDTLGSLIFQPAYLRTNNNSWYKTFWGYQLVIAFTSAFIAGIYITHFDMYELFSESGFAGATRIFQALLQPNFEVFPKALLAIIQTIFIAFMATVLAIPAAFILGFLAAKNIMGNSKVGFLIYGLLRTLFNISRSIEPLIWAIVFSVWVGIGPFAGMLALMLHSIASLTKQYSEIIECINDGPVEGIQSTGASQLQTIWFAVVPQITLPIVSFTIYRWDINVRMATVIGLVGGGGIGTMLIQYQGQALWNEVGCLVVMIAAVVWIMDTASAYIREAIK